MRRARIDVISAKENFWSVGRKTRTSLWAWVFLGAGIRGRKGGLVFGKQGAGGGRCEQYVRTRKESSKGKHVCLLFEQGLSCWSLGRSLDCFLGHVDGGTGGLWRRLGHLNLGFLDALVANLVMAIGALFCLALEGRLAHMTRALIAVSRSSFWCTLGFFLGSFDWVFGLFGRIARALGAATMLTAIAFLIVPEGSVAAVTRIPDPHLDSSLYSFLWLEVPLWRLVHIVKIILRQQCSSSIVKQGVVSLDDARLPKRSFCGRCRLRFALTCGGGTSIRSVRSLRQGSRETHAVVGAVRVAGSAPDGPEVEVLPLRIADLTLPNILVRLFLRSEVGVCDSIVSCSC